MFVYKKGTLKEVNLPVIGKPNTFVLRLMHVTSGMVIEVEYQTGVNNLAQPFVVYKEENGVYVIYKKFTNKVNLKDNFEDAIEFFEDQIFKQLNEAPPQQSQPPAEGQDPPETYSELPEIDDIVKVGNQYGKVVSRDEATGEIGVEPMTKKEAMQILRAIRDAKRMTINLDEF